MVKMENPGNMSSPCTSHALAVAEPPEVVSTDTLLLKPSEIIDLPLWVLIPTTSSKKEILEQLLFREWWCFLHILGTVCLLNGIISGHQQFTKNVDIWKKLFIYSPFLSSFIPFFPFLFLFLSHLISLVIACILSLGVRIVCPCSPARPLLLAAISLWDHLLGQNH